MSGAELIGIISGIISIVDASLKIYEAVEDVSGLPRSFRNAIARLPVVQDTLETARASLEEEEEEGKSRAESRKALAKILNSCYDKAAALSKTLRTTMPRQGARKTERYLKAIKLIPAADKVDCLMNGILHDVQVLAANYSVKSVTRRQFNGLVGMVRQVEKQEFRCSERRATISLYNTGSGSQFIYDGPGNQNVSINGKGTQLTSSPTVPIHISLTR